MFRFLTRGNENRDREGKGKNSKQNQEEEMEEQVKQGRRGGIHFVAGKSKYGTQRRPSLAHIM